MITIAKKVFKRNDYQYLETVWQTGPESFGLVGHTAEPYGGPYARDLTLWEFLRWATPCPEQVTLIPAGQVTHPSKANRFFSVSKLLRFQWFVLHSSVPIHRAKTRLAGTPSPPAPPNP